ncbi:MAG TPA: tRNA pseudouridine(55) synthase TruB [Candidatus Baltobacteraceae bacterium]|jgi:tRNA pseudouridine55 synthase|nr:tRNA pseudouridine(55) synthase TruB [Candidatus Baltobacteraceae bacterium]
MFAFVNVFKPVGLTSVQIGARLRRIYGGRERLAVGHFGTLDPAAAGVLPIALGKATRLLPMIEDRRKSYAFTVIFGRSTTSADATGETLRTASISVDLAQRLPEIIPRFCGIIDQFPPMYSAVHHHGRRLYELARRGESVERKSRRATIFSLRLLGLEGAVARMRVVCSEGTYVRTLCEDLGEALGLPAHMGALVREAAGPFVLEESRVLAEIEDDPAAALIPPEHVLSFPEVVLDARGAADFRSGRNVVLPDVSTASPIFVRDSTRSLLGVGEMRGADLTPRRVFV